MHTNPPPEQPPTNPSPYNKYEPETTYSETPSLSDTLVAETSDEEDCFVPRSQVSNSREDMSASNSDRYFKQQRSAQGKLAYVVFSGRSVGVFYNWTATALAISGLEYSSRVFKGYSSYEAAHSAWDGFAGTGRLPADVALSLGTRSYPTPPMSSAPPPSTPQRRIHAPSIPMPLTPHGTLTSINTVKTPASPSTPSTSTSTQNRTLAIVREEGFRADQEDFWVVFTGTAPGVHKGRKAGEKAFGQFANPSFVRTSTREHANQIFVDAYMEFLVARHTN